MTRTCCPECRLRFSCSASEPLRACPFCAGSLELRGAEASLGFKLIELDRPVAGEAAVARAATLPSPPRD
jgi:hypothetical protein